MNFIIDQGDMNRHLAIVFVLGMLTTAIPEQSNAQKVGAGIAYGNKLNMVGGQIGATYRFHRYFRVAGNVSVFLPKDFENSNNSWNWWSINMDGNFVFVETGRFRSYVLAGLNYATIQVNYAQTGARSVDSDLGLNAGAGLEYSLEFGDLYGEVKHVFIGERYKQTALDVGVRFYLTSK